MILLEMILLWATLLATICMISLVLQAHEYAIPVTLMAVSLITMYVTLVRHSSCIKDSVVFG